MFGYFIFLVMAKPCLSVAVVSFVAHTELLVLTHCIGPGVVLDAKLLKQILSLTQGAAQGVKADIGPSH